MIECGCGERFEPVVEYRHRLLCGDSTDAGAVGRLMGGEKAQILLTSPPYWVGFEYEQETSINEVISFINAICDLLPTYVNNDGRIIINTGTVQAKALTNKKAHMKILIDLYINRLELKGWLMRYIRFWVKDGGLLHTSPQSDCIDQHTEFLGYFYNPSAKFRGHERTGEGWSGKGYWNDIQGEARQSNHIAAFPVELAARNIKLFTRDGELIFDPFLGSGTTMIAAHQLNRRCFGIEIHPPYVAVCLQRLADTGLTPKRLEA